MKLELGEDVELYLQTFAAMTENEVRRCTRARLPTEGERLLFDDLSRGCSKGTVDLVAARAVIRVKTLGSACTK
jgi:hypothetical protein